MKQLPALYPTSVSSPFQSKTFKNPPPEYRGAPFWSWNCRLDKKELSGHLDIFEKMGMGGATIHCRTGLDTPYMGPEFMEIVNDSVDRARRKGMRVWLYDEDRWPSGYGGGLVTRDQAYRARHLLWTCCPYGSLKKHTQEFFASTAGTGRTENGRLLFIYDVILDKNGFLQSYKRVKDESHPQGRLWYAYLETAPEQSWFNNQTYVDTLNPRAIERFIETTHEVYYKKLKKDFGSTVPAIFTDEPQFPHKQTFSCATNTSDIIIPFTDDLMETFRQAYGTSLEDHLPEIFWEWPDRRPSQARYQYHDHVAERFSSAFADTLYQWCGNHHIALTGHMMEEPSLFCQTHALGEAMRSYRSFHIPGIDILCDHHPHVTGRPIEFTTAKQAQSAARQYGRPGVMSEIYGVTNWDFTFLGHKAEGDWQAALGVTVRIHHLAWVSMAGEAKRDYPASIFHQSPWHREYDLVENHFARLNTALTRGRSHVRVGVLHPIESYWLCFGPEEHTHDERTERDGQFAQLTTWLVHNQTDWDFICESLLPSQSPAKSGKALKVGVMSYDLVLVPPMRTIRSTTLDRLETFLQAGGRLVFCGEIPTLVDAVPSDRAQELANRSRTIGFSRLQISDALNEVRDFGVYSTSGTLVDQLACQIRNDGSDKFVFVCNTDRALGWDSNPHGFECFVKIKGHWLADELDTLNGEKRRVNVTQDNGWTVIPRYLTPAGHFLLHLKPGHVKSSKPLNVRAINWREAGHLKDLVPVTLSEPNVLLLDQARWKVNRGPWQPVDEMLRLDGKVRQAFGQGPKDFAMAQPWTDTRPNPVLGTVSLGFKIHSEIPIRTPLLAMENAENARIFINGREVTAPKKGWWVDRCLTTRLLPTLKPGITDLVITYTYTRLTDLENLFLLGDFGVQLSGRHAILIKPVKKLGWGNWVNQGLPFYAGNVTYHTTLAVDGSPTRLMVDHWKGPVITAKLDGREIGKIAFPPYSLTLESLRAGKHALDLTVFGNRYNAFGNFHYSGRNHWYYYGCPIAYRTQGFDFTYEYQLRPMGILAAPRLNAQDTVK